MLKTTLIEKKAMSVINQFDTSTTNLQKSLQKDIDLIKINAGIVMKNIMRITDVFFFTRQKHQANDAFKIRRFCRCFSWRSERS